MPDVVVNINGNPTGGQNQSPNNQRQTAPPRQGVVQPQQPPVNPQPSNYGGGSGSAPQQPNNGGSAAPNTSTGNMPAMPTFDRIAQDIRREMQTRGCLLVPGSANFNQLMSQVQSQYKNKADDAVDAKYNNLRQEITQRRQSEVDALIESFNNKRDRALEKHPENADTINANFDRLIQEKLGKIDKKYLLEYTDLEDNASQERANVDKELAKIAAEIVQEMKRGNSNSYLGRLRGELNEARWRRDNAETEDEAKDASREMAAIQRRMMRAMGGSRNPLQQFNTGWGTAVAVGNIGMNAYNAYLKNTGSEIDIVSQAANGNAFGAMQADLQRRRQNYAAWGAGVGGLVGAVGGGVAAALGSFGIGTGAGIAGGAALGGGAGSWIGNSVFQLLYGNEENQLKLGSLWSDQEKRLAAYTPLAMVVRGNGSVEDTRNRLMNQFSAGDGEGYATSSGITAHDLGYTNAEFANQVANRAKQRGFISNANDAVWRALNADALEKVYNMNPGSLGQLSAYDRYRRGNDSTQDVANLVASLRARHVLGMSSGQTLRTNEFVNYQTQLMEMQKSYMLNPSSNYAQRQLLAAQDVYGNALDNRGIQAMGQIDSAITNPQEGYSKAILYDVIQNVMPSTRGNLLKIRQAQYSNDPETRMRIQRAMFRRLTQIYGGADTTSGYLALSQFTGIQNPEELKRWTNRIQRGLPQVTQGSYARDTAATKEYTQPVSKQMLQYQDNTTKMISERLGDLNGVASQMLNTFKGQLDEIINDLKSK